MQFNVSDDVYYIEEFLIGHLELSSPSLYQLRAPSKQDSSNDLLSFTLISLL